MSTLLDLQTQILSLQKQADVIKSQDFDKTILEIRQSMELFGITFKDLEKVQRKPRAEKVKVTETEKKPVKAPASKQIGKPVAAKFRGPNGETWSGRGLAPKWLTSLIATGANKSDFAVDGEKAAPKVHAASVTAPADASNTATEPAAHTEAPAAHTEQPDSTSST